MTIVTRSMSKNHCSIGKSKITEHKIVNNKPLSKKITAKNTTKPKEALKNTIRQYGFCRPFVGKTKKSGKWEFESIEETNRRLEKGLSKLDLNKVGLKLISIIISPKINDYGTRNCAVLFETNEEKVAYIDDEYIPGITEYESNYEDDGHSSSSLELCFMDNEFIINKFGKLLYI